MHSSCLEQKSKSFIQSMENNDNLMKKKNKKSWQAVKFRKGRRGEGGQKLVESLALAEVKFSKKAGSPRAFRGHGVNRVLRGVGG